MEGEWGGVEYMRGLCLLYSRYTYSYRTFATWMDRCMVVWHVVSRDCLLWPKRSVYATKDFTFETPTTYSLQHRTQIYVQM